MAETRCDLCRHYARLEIPYHYEKTGYPDGVTVYGFCAKDVAARGVFFPVYLPDSGVCQAFHRFARARREQTASTDQLEIPMDTNGRKSGTQPQREDV